MEDEDNIGADLQSWFQQGDELAHRRAYKALARRLNATREAIDAIGQGAADEVRQDVLSKLLDRERGALRNATHPHAYARRTWVNALTSEIRKWAPRTAREAEVRRHVVQITDQDDGSAAEVRLDADRALEIANGLDGKGRLAILLTTRPSAVSDAEWSQLVASLPPPPPVRPVEALDRDEASRLLFPPTEPEDTKRRYQRLNSYDKTYMRAIERIRAALESNS